MPATMTHQMFALEIIRRSNSSFLSKYVHVLMLATQGPDPFFFCGMVPWRSQKNASNIRAMGHYFHYNNPQKDLHALYSNAIKKGSETLKAYAIGAIMHYILDKHVHPYVFSKSGFDSLGQLSHPFYAYHFNMEVLIDVALLTELSYKAKEVHPEKSIIIPSKTLTEIDCLYSESYKDVCLKGWFKSSVLDMRTTYKVVYDAFGMKRRIFKLLLGKNASAFVISHPVALKNKENKDVLNKQNVSWRHPETGTTKKESVIDLFNDAINEMLLIVKSIELNQFDETFVLGDLSYDGTHKNEVMKYQTMMFPIL